MKNLQTRTLLWPSENRKLGNKILLHVRASGSFETVLVQRNLQRKMQCTYLYEVEKLFKFDKSKMKQVANSGCPIFKVKCCEKKVFNRVTIHAVSVYKEQLKKLTSLRS